MHEYKNTDNWKEKLYSVADILANILDESKLADIDLQVLLELQSFFADYAGISSHSELKKLLDKLSDHLRFQLNLIPE